MLRESKSAQLQIRVSPAQKAALERAARKAGMDMSRYVLNLVLPELAPSFAAHVEACGDEATWRFALAALNTFLADLTAGELRSAVASPPPATLDEFMANYVAAMVEFSCARAAIPPPAWVRSIKPLEQPFFGSTLPSLRLYLLANSPAPFRYRNLFIDSSVGDQV